MLEYVQELQVFTGFVIKSDKTFLREQAILLLAAWVRINTECVNSKMEFHDQIKQYISEICTGYVESSVQDLSGVKEEEGAEQFETGEKEGLTAKDDIVARLLNVEVVNSYIQLNQGFSYLYQLYQKAIEMKNEEQMKLVEGRFTWLLNVFTSMMNLGFSPFIQEDQGIQNENETHMILKGIELVKLSSDLAKEQKYKGLETFELAILKFLISIRRSILTDH